MRRRRAGAGRILATVLFTDIVGSTQLAAELGDRGWRDLVARHHRIIRAELKRFGGREQDTAGDGFFATFDRPAQAIECAAAAMERLAPLGLQIRAAVHTGEAEVMGGGKVGGIAVHVAARVLAQGQPAEILVSGTVRDVAAGSGIRFEDRGVHELRGIPGEWHLYAVDRDTAGVVPVPAQRAGTDEPAQRSRLRWPVLVAIVGVLLLAGAVGAVMRGAGSPSAPPSSPRPNSAVRIDPATNGMVAVASVGGTPTEVAIGDDGTAWVLGTRDSTVTLIPTQGDIKTIGPGGAPTGIATGAGTTWITFGYGVEGSRAGALRRFSATGERIGDAVGVPNGTFQLAIGEDAVWATNAVENLILKIDANTASLVGDPVEAADQPDGIATGEGSVWVANSVSRTVWRLDPATLERRAEIAVGDQPTRLAVAFGRVWVTSTQGNSLTVIDAASGGIATRLAIGGAPRAVAAGAGAVWVALGEGAVVRVDPESLEIAARVSLPGPVDGIAASDDTVWAAIQ